jgi:proteasome lid subunit RPN8/RPN11
MIGHAREVLPLEAVGLLGGAGDGSVRRRISLPNAMQGVMAEKRFMADPYAQFQALRQLSAEGLAPLAVYHSHPGGGTHLSAADVSYARDLPYLHLVIALDRPHDPVVDVAAYRVTGAVIEVAQIEVVDE